VTISVPRVVGAELSTSEIEVTVADGVRDIDDALAVIHDGFVEAGYLTPRPSGRRMHPSYLNPGTVFLVARIDGETVGTCAMVADGPFGLPSDRAFAEENDLMRAEGPVVRECGSLAVSGSHRRHTRRIVMRLFAAATRLALDEFPDSPVVVAVTPENERFYAAIAGAVRVADPRPLFGAPAVLLRTGGPPLALHCAQRATPTQRTMDALITELDPEWIADHRRGAPLPDDWLGQLLDEGGVTGALVEQLRLVAAGSPSALDRIVRRAGRRVAA